MNDDQPGEIPEVAENLDSNLDNFDLRTPAEAAADEANQPKEDPKPEEPQVEDNPQVEGAPNEEAPVETPKEEAKPYEPPQRMKVEVPPFEMEIPRDEYGNIDPEKMQEYLQARDEHMVKVAEATAQNAMFENTYLQREWQDVGSAYPEIVENESLRTMAENIRTADALRGGEGSLMAAAEQIVAIRKAEREAGKAEAQTNITRQKTVSLQSSPQAQNIDVKKQSNLRKAAANGDENARIAYIQSLMETGALNA